MLKGINHSKACQDSLFTSINNYLEGKVTFGDPFEDSGVASYQHDFFSAAFSTDTLKLRS